MAILISGLRLAEPDADAGRRFLKAAGDAAPRPALHGDRARVRCDARRVYGWPLHLAMVHHGAHDGRRRCCSLVATVYCFRIIPMGFIPSQDTGQINGQTEMAQGLGYESMVEHQLEVMEIIQADPERQVGHLVDRPRWRRWRRGGQRRPAADRAEAARRNATLTADQVIAVAAAEDRRDARRARVPDEPARDQHRRPARRARSTSSRCRAATRETLYARQRSSRRELHDLPGLADVSSDLLLDQSAGQRHARSRSHRRPGAHRRSGRERDASAPSARGRSRRSTRRTTPTRSSCASRRSTSATPRRCTLLHLRTAERQAGAALEPDARRHRRRPAVREPHRPAAVGDDVVQPAPGRGARRRRGAGRAERAHRAARVDRDELPGHARRRSRIRRAASASSC